MKTLSNKEIVFLKYFLFIAGNISVFTAGASWINFGYYAAFCQLIIGIILELLYVAVIYVQGFGDAKKMILPDDDDIE